MNPFSDAAPRLDMTHSDAWQPDRASACSVDAARRFGSLERAFGQEVLGQLSSAHVVVAGIGGVGSWAVEALARSAIGRLTLIDMDHVVESNINRQVHALESTLGQAKVLCMAQRVAQINPTCDVVTIDEFVTPDNVCQMIPDSADVVIDCTDQLDAKVAMVLCARERRQRLLVCGAAGGKTDALSMKRGDLRDSTHDPLLARLRQTLRKNHGYPGASGRRVAAMGVSVLWLEQPVRRPAPTVGLVQGGRQPGAPLACAGYGSLVTVTASMGLAAAGWAIEMIVQNTGR